MPTASRVPRTSARSQAWARAPKNARRLGSRVRLSRLARRRFSAPRASARSRAPTRSVKRRYCRSSVVTRVKVISVTLTAIAKKVGWPENAKNSTKPLLTTSAMVSIAGRTCIRHTWLTTAVLTMKNATCERM